MDYYYLFAYLISILYYLLKPLMTNLIKNHHHNHFLMNNIYIIFINITYKTHFLSIDIITTIMMTMIYTFQYLISINLNSKGFINISFHALLFILLLLCIVIYRGGFCKYKDSIISSNDSLII